MASVKVAVRVRPFNQREKDMNAKLIVQMDGKKTRLTTVKNSKESDASREKYKDFTFDHSYWSYDHSDGHYASQEQVFADLGVEVIESAFEGYNACVFAYGQTGSGKTFTMMGSPECQGLIPRICRQLFSRMATGKETGASYRTEVSYLEIYNERVKDLLANDAGHSLRVREHPKLGPYVQDLSKHLVSDYDDIQVCMHRGNLQRTTASTQMNDVSSRSHAIFTITFVQASYQHNNMPSETVSKVHLVDLAGSERADATGATGQRLVEGAHINKSLVTLGSVISALADASSQKHEDVRNGPSRTPRKTFIPYRDSVLTWLLKDSLGGNSKTIMIAAISPADVNYGETLSTLRYANRAKNIINSPTINEDPNVKLIRELRDEILKLRAQIDKNTDQIDTEPGVLATLQRKEAQEKVLTEKWTEKWRETQQILQEQKALGLRKSGLGVVLDSDMPHLIGIDDNLLSTGVTLYHLKEGETVIGTDELSPTPDIVISGAGVLARHCVVELRGGEARLRPAPGAACWLNTVPLDSEAKLSQGCIILLGRTNMFRYNDPAEAAKLRQEGSAHAINLSRLSLLSCSNTDLALSTDNLHGDLENSSRSELLELQRAELERERQLFQLQQEERQQQLIDARRRLDEERTAMEQRYALHEGDAARNARAHGHAEQVDAELNSIAKAIEAKESEIEEFARSQLEILHEKGVYDKTTAPEGESSTECLMRLVKSCDSVVQDVFDKHKQQLSELQWERRQRAAAAKLADGSPHDSTSVENLKRCKSELTLRPAKDDDSQPLSADERERHNNDCSPIPLSLATPRVSSLRTPARDDDSDELSSTEDYHRSRAEGQSSSSERSVDRVRARRRRTGSGGGRRQVTEAEALRAMARLCSNIASQKGRVIAALEGDCSKEELNRQIAVLQDLQKKYVRLEMALQYSMFETATPTRVEPPIQEASITAESDVNCNTPGDPLTNRLKESEMEASDNVSTSNDDLHSEGAWSDADERRGEARARHLDTAMPAEISVPVNYDLIVSIPGWVTRGAGAGTHYEYEVRLGAGGGSALVLLRRYRRFRDLHLAMCRQYPDTVPSIPFPPRQLWSFERVARSRRVQLERYLRQLLTTISLDPRSPLYARPPTRAALADTAPFFRKGVFESGKCGTG